MKISVFGLGYVGCVGMACLADSGHEVIGVDVNKSKINQINQGKPTIVEKDIDDLMLRQFQSGKVSATEDGENAVANTELSFIAVGTPSSKTGHLYLQYIYNVAETIGRGIRQKSGFHTVAVRSTVLPGTSKRIEKIIEEYSGKEIGKDFAVVSNPEFLREGSAISDYRNPPLTVIGCESDIAFDLIKTLYSDMPAEIVRTDVATAEIMKYVNNTFHALKISFANEVGNICSALQIDSREVMNILIKDKVLNISEYYMKPGFAYGGSCLPKDLKAFQMLSHDNYLKTPLIDSINQTNEVQIQRAIDLVLSFNIRSVGILGLAFKAGTDDLRNSPTIRLVEALLGVGVEIVIYDSNINLSMVFGRNKDFIQKSIPHLSELMVDDPKKLMKFSELVIIGTNESDWIDLFPRGSEMNVLDLVGIDGLPEKIDNYFGINWGRKVNNKYHSREDTVL